MTEDDVANVADGIAYEEREAVAVFDNESSLNAAVDALMLAGLRQDDLSVLADAGSFVGTNRDQPRGQGEHSADRVRLSGFTH
jgi:hypothetical protein